MTRFSCIQWIEDTQDGLDRERTAKGSGESRAAADYRGSLPVDGPHDDARGEEMLYIHTHGIALRRLLENRDRLLRGVGTPAGSAGGPSLCPDVFQLQVLVCVCDSFFLRGSCEPKAKSPA